ncbi:MAG: tetratricopeptide repeat protein [Thermodesulfobacteriota bacterium]
MDWQGKQAQWGMYLVLLLAVGLAASAGYHHAHREMVLFRRAEVAFVHRDLPGAILLYRQAIEAGLIDATARRRLAEAYRRQGNTALAMGELELALGDHPHDTQLIDELAGLYTQAGELDKGIALAGRLPEDPAVRFPFWQRLGDLAVAGQRFEQATTCYRNALASAPGEVSVSVKLATVLGWQRRYDEAVALFAQVLARQPDHRPARLGLARVLGWAGRLDEAIEQYRKLLENER